MNKYWVSWYHYDDMGDFTFKDENPCWESGYLPVGALIYVAAIKTFEEYLAKEEVFIAYERLRTLQPCMQVEDIDFRYIIKKPDDWSPFCDRFPRADWMVWD